MYEVFWAQAHGFWGWELPLYLTKKMCLTEIPPANSFFQSMIISGCAVLLTFLLPSRENLGIYPEKYPNMYDSRRGIEPRNVSVTWKWLGPRKARHLYDEA